MHLIKREAQRIESAKSLSENQINYSLLGIIEMNSSRKRFAKRLAGN